MLSAIRLSAIRLSAIRLSATISGADGDPGSLLAEYSPGVRAYPVRPNAAFRLGSGASRVPSRHGRASLAGVRASSLR
jgi:hypothetical protein